jgi:hypothetical protein
MSNVVIGKINGEGYADYIIDDIPFLGGTYYVSAALLNQNDRLFDFANKATSFSVIPSEVNQNGLIKLTERWEIKG